MNDLITKAIIALLSIAVGVFGTFAFLKATNSSDPKNETIVEEQVQEKEVMAAENNPSKPSFDFFKQMKCENNKDSFKYFTKVNENGYEFSEAFGTFEFTGKLFIENAPEPFEEDKYLDFVRMQVSPDGSKAYEYYKKLAITNLRADPTADLEFRIGTYENGQLLSTAKISESLKSKIISAAKGGEQMTLTFTVPTYEGMGMPAYFSWACEIR